jgi:hypothetical protein
MEELVVEESAKLEWVSKEEQKHGEYAHDTGLGQA